MGTDVVDRRVRVLFWASAALVWLGNALLMRQWQSLTGQPPGDGALAFDLLLMLPALYLWLHRRRGRKAWLGAAGVLGIGLLLGRTLLPARHLPVWDWLAWLRSVVSIGVLGAEVVMVAWIVRALWRLRGEVNRELALDDLLRASMPHLGRFEPLLRMEARMWLFALARRPIRAAYPGHVHFSVHAQHGNASNQQAFLLLMALEMPLMHLLLHFAWSPRAALVVTLLSAYGWLLLAEYRATLQRPVSLEADALQLRYGIVTDVRLPLAAIRSVEAWRDGIAPRRHGRMRCHGMGAPNVSIRLQPGTRVAGALGARTIDEILLGVDAPGAFVDTLTRVLHGEAPTRVSS